MWVNLFMTPPPDLSALSSSEKDALLTALLARVEGLMARRWKPRTRRGGRT